MALENIAIFWVSWKIQRGDPSIKIFFQKIFISDFAQIFSVKSFGYKDFKFWISLKSETKNFWDKFFIEGSPLWIFQEIQKIAIFSKAIDEKFFFGQFLN